MVREKRYVLLLIKEMVCKSKRLPPVFLRAQPPLIQFIQRGSSTSFHDFLLHFVIKFSEKRVHRAVLKNCVANYKEDLPIFDLLRPL
jgi:hypothetical protein